jgi:hypothetical protein
MFMFRWVPYEGRGNLLGSLAGGLTELLECVRGAPDAQVVVLAHSAGGVLASLALGLVSMPAVEGTRLLLATAASPLAGTGYRRGAPLDDEDIRFMVELGNELGAYPEVPRGARVVHYRTHFPADPAMRPTPWGHAPNAPGVGVRGARHEDLPPTVGHDEALLEVARAVAGRRL